MATHADPDDWLLISWADVAVVLDAAHARALARTIARAGQVAEELARDLCSGRVIAVKRSRPRLLDAPTSGAALADVHDSPYEITLVEGHTDVL